MQCAISNLEENTEILSTDKMSFTQRQDSSDTQLNDSWVELNFQQHQQQHILTTSTPVMSGVTTPSYVGLTPPRDPSMSKPISHGTMEKLLLEAQREWSRASSRVGSNVGSTVDSNGSSHGSPKSPRSPSNELSSVGLGDLTNIQEDRLLPPEVTTDWIWDWSSRIEAMPPGEINGSKYKHPSRTPLSVRNTKVMGKGPFSLENLPAMILTHACTFFLGAAVMFVYLKKYCGWSSKLFIMPVD